MSNARPLPIEPAPGSHPNDWAPDQALVLQQLIREANQGERHPAHIVKRVLDAAVELDLAETWVVDHCLCYCYGYWPVNRASFGDEPNIQWMHAGALARFMFALVPQPPGSYPSFLLQPAPGQELAALQSRGEMAVTAPENWSTPQTPVSQDDPRFDDWSWPKSPGTYH